MKGLIALLVEDLQSENRSVRCEALRQLIEQPFEKDVHELLNGILQEPGQDPEIQFLARQAIHGYELRQQQGSVVFPPAENLTELGTRLFALPLPEFERIAAHCPPERVLDLLDCFRERLGQVSDHERLLAMVPAFRRWGRAEDAPKLVPLLKAPQPLLVIEVIGALERLNPKGVLEVLPVAFASPYMPVQVRALRTLLKADFLRGVEQLRRMFSSEHPSVRASAVMLCMAVPFHRVKELIYNALASEEDLRILARAAYLLFINPEENTIYWLMDVAATASPPKAKWCMQTIDAVLEAIRLSGIMEGSVVEFAARIRQLLEKRQTNTLLDTLFAELADPEPMRRFEALEALREYEQIPEVRQKFREVFQQESDSRVKALLTTIFADNPDRKRLQQEISPGRFTKLAREEQLALLGQIRGVEEYSWVRENLRGLLRGRYDPIVHAEIARLMGRFGDAKGELAPLSMALKSTEPLLQARGIEGLQKIDPDFLLKELPKLIRSQAPMVRSAALRAFFRQDKAAALEALHEMLSGDSSAVKEHAIVCLAQMSYSSTRPLLLRFLKEESNMALVKKAGLILRNNPDLDAIRNIHETMRAAAGTRRQVIFDVLSDCLLGAREAGLITETPKDYLEKLQIAAAAEEQTASPFRLPDAV